MLLSSAFILVLGVIGTFLLSKILKNPAIVDCYWGLGILLVGIAYAFSHPVKLVQFVFLIGIALWSLRLTVFIYITRIRQKVEDRRYADLRDRWGSKKELKTLLTGI